MVSRHALNKRMTDMNNSHMMHIPSGFPILALKSNNQILLPQSFTIDLNENRIYVKTDAGLIPMEDLRYVTAMDSEEIAKRFDPSVLVVREFNGRLQIKDPRYV